MKDLAKAAVLSFASDKRRFDKEYALPEDIALVALACLRVPTLGNQVFNVVAPDTVSDLPTRDLLERFHPGTELRSDLPGQTPAWSTRRVQDVLAVTPHHSWRQVLAST